MAGDDEQDIFGRDGVKGKADGYDSGEEELPIKKMASMSLAARVKMKLGAKSAAAPAVRSFFFSGFPLLDSREFMQLYGRCYQCLYECCNYIRIVHFLFLFALQKNIMEVSLKSSTSFVCSSTCEQG